MSKLYELDDDFDRDRYVLEEEYDTWLDEQDLEYGFWFVMMDNGGEYDLFDG